MQDMKLTDQCAGHEIDGHENAGHENDIPKMMLGRKVAGENIQFS